MSSSLLFEKKDQIGYLTLNRPDSLNSLSLELMAELQKTVASIAKDKTLRAVVIRGSGKVFCAGGDLKQFSGFVDLPVEDTKHKIEQGILALETAIVTLHQLPIPVLAAVHGAVAGAGIGLMLAADLVLAVENTRFGLAYSKIGLTPDGGTTYFLSRVVGVKKMMELLMLADEFTAENARHYGLINWICRPDDFSQKIEEIAERLANGPTSAFQQLKELVYASQSNNLQQQLDLERKNLLQSFLSQDFKIGLKAFVNKQRPAFIGK